MVMVVVVGVAVVVVVVIVVVAIVVVVVVANGAPPSQLVPRDSWARVGDVLLAGRLCDISEDM
jgi:hypothetical protein